MPTTSKKSPSPYYNKNEVKKRGWTDTAINKFLGKPDKTGRNRYRKRGTVNLYLKDRVHRIERSTEYGEWKIASEKRRESARKAAETKRAETLSKVESRLHTIELADKYKNLRLSELQEARHRILP